MGSAFITLARPVQWVKNSIVFAALVFAGEAAKSDKLLTSFFAFALFCMLSSSIYVFNDIFDRQKDKLHPLKKYRPLASEKISVISASIFGLILMIIGIGGAYFINTNLLIIAVIFVVLNLFYSSLLKNIVIVDVMTIAFSFVLRALAGAYAIDVPASKWLLINTMLLALFLGFGKRRHELVLLESNATSHRSSLERYSPYLLDQLIGVVTASVVVMYMLYTFSNEVSLKLGTENLFLTIPFVIYGIFRYLYLIHKEEKGGSPTSLLINDKPILFTVIFWTITVLIVMYLL